MGASLSQKTRAAEALVKKALKRGQKLAMSDAMKQIESADTDRAEIERKAAERLKKLGRK